MDKAIMLAAMPLLAFIILICFLTFYIRKGRPLTLRLSGLGIRLEITSAPPGLLDDDKDTRT